MTNKIVATLALVSIFALGATYGRAREAQRWQWLTQGESSWTVVHLKGGGTQSFDFKGGVLTDGGVTTLAEHVAIATQDRTRWEAQRRLRESYVYAADSRQALLTYLRELAAADPRLLGTLGIVGVDGNYRAVRASDLQLRD